MDYFPRRDGDRAAWALNIKAQIATVAPTLGLSNDDLAGVQVLCDDIAACIGAAETATARQQEAVKKKEELETGGSITKIRMKVAQWKTTDGYTESIGALLGVLSTSPAMKKDAYKAELSGTVTGNVVRLKFVKNGADGLNIYKRRKGSAFWNFLARDTNSPYDDHIVPETPSQPEHWEYIAYGVKQDLEFGAPSDIVQVIYGAIA